jgi:hypothetical protein
VADAHTGAVVAVQRTDSALRLNVHLHALVLDGVYVRNEHGALVFHALPMPIVDGRDRRRVERLARYITRPPVAQERLTRRPDGRLELELNSVWKNGTRALVLDAADPCAGATSPPPRMRRLV